ncbi:DNA translocase FtsK [Ancylobacter lacus]|nr:DNA translocase FtsK [Ancylobacter lacus]
MPGPVRPARPVPRTNPLPGARPPGTPAPAPAKHVAAYHNDQVTARSLLGRPEQPAGTMPPLSAPLLAAPPAPSDGGAPAPSHSTVALAPAQGPQRPSRATPAPARPPPPRPGRTPRAAAPAPEADPFMPSWLRPFTLPTNVNTRFTRTPDYLLRPQQVAAVAEPEGASGPADALSKEAPAGPPVGSADPAHPLHALRPPPLIVPRSGAWGRGHRASAPEAGSPEAGAEAASEPEPAPGAAAPEPQTPVLLAPLPDVPGAGSLPAAVAAVVAPVADATPVTVAQAPRIDDTAAAQAVVAPVASVAAVFAAPAAVAPAETPALPVAAPVVAAPVVAPVAAAPAPVSPAAAARGAGGPPANVRRIAELIRLDWEAPPVAAPVVGLEEDDADAPLVQDEIAPAVESDALPAGHEDGFAADAGFTGLPVAGADVRYSFAWPVFVPPQEAAPSPAAIAPAAPAPVASVAAPAAPLPAQPEPQPEALPEPVAPSPAPALHVAADGYEFPPIELLAEPPQSEPDFELSEEFLERNSVKLQQVLHDFGVRGEIIDANPGPVVTLYELEPAPGIKSSRVTGLSADIARSMSAISTRVAVVEGRNVIGIELPNQRRETVWLREMLASHEFEATAARSKLAIALGKTIGGEPVIVDLARMPHLLVAGTTGSGKSVAINTMILSLLYRHRPEQCRLIMIDPKMLELSVYEGIPHLLTPVVTDPKKAIIALKWAVREMEERYKKMSRLAVRNIDGFNARVAEARAKGEIITRTVQTGFDRETGQMQEEEEIMDLAALPYIVVVVDEMADLMMVAGKEIEGAIQRLAQMARAAGIHIIMATQRPSVDVITGTIKANFPTRISFQVTSKIDSRTILGEMGAEQLLGQGDMLYMAGGGRISRVHGPFVSDHEVEKVVQHLKRQGRPDYIEAVTAEEGEEIEEAEDAAVFDKSAMGEEPGDLYDQAVAVVMRDRKASTSYIQRRLQIGYNRAASIMERMENEGLVGPANHAGKREILASR